jgi:hypothetical protein
MERERALVAREQERSKGRDVLLVLARANVVSVLAKADIVLIK